MEHKSLTPKEAETLEAIKNLIKEKGYPPTIREIAEYRGLKSTGFAQYALKSLKRKGYIDWEANASRTLRIK